MVGAFKVLVRPDCSLVDFRQSVRIEFVGCKKLIILQDGQSVKIDMRMDLAFGLDDYFFNRIQKPEKRF